MCSTLCIPHQNKPTTIDVYLLRVWFLGIIASLRESETLHAAFQTLKLLKDEIFAQ